MSECIRCGAPLHPFDAQFFEDCMTCRGDRPVGQIPRSWALRPKLEFQADPERKLPPSSGERQRKPRPTHRPVFPRRPE